MFTATKGIIKMTELEKIAYAKSFIDKLANGINPLEDTPVPDDDLVNNVRLSRCFFYVSGILQKEMEREKKKEHKKTGTKQRMPYITYDQLQKIEYSNVPLSITLFVSKINSLVWGDILQKKVKKLTYFKVIRGLENMKMVEYREWKNGTLKKFPTADGEAVGIIWREFEGRGGAVPVIYLTETLSIAWFAEMF